MALSDSGIIGRGEFPSTAFSAIRELKDPGSPEYQRHMAKLVEQYWRPVYCVIRHAWRTSAVEAKDLTQEFFAEVVLDGRLVGAFSPERGSFRALLRTAIGNFMRNDRRDAAREKRGGGMYTLSLDDVASDLAERLAGDPRLQPEQVFDLAWSQVVFGEALRRLEQRLVGEGRGDALELFRRYDLDEEREQRSYAELGAQLGLSESQVRHALAHARRAFRDAFTEVVAESVDGPEALAAELRNLALG